MDVTKKTQLSLEQVLVSYNILVLFIIIFIILLFVLFLTNQKGFNKAFGYEVFITVPILLAVAFLIKQIFALKNNPQLSLFSSFTQSKENWFVPVLILLTISIALLGFFMVLYIGGIFSNSPPENNTAMMLNFFIIISFLIISGIIYNNYKNKDNNILKTLPKALQDAFDLRTKYTAIFIVFVLVITLLYFFNPWNIMTNYGGPVIFFSLFVGIIMVTMITIYQYFLSNPSNANSIGQSPGPLVFFTKGIYILGSLGVSFGLIYGLLYLMGFFNQDASKPESWGHIIFNLILFASMLGIIYKLANAGGFLDKNPYYRLVLNTLLYIPCLLVLFVNQILGLTKTTSETFSPPKPFEIKILVVSLILLSSYFLWEIFGKKYLQSIYLKQGGKQLINQPIQTNIVTNVSSYQKLSGSDNFDYQYAMSFWVYLDAFPPSTNSSYNKVVSLLSYGENPSIKYSSENNTLYITVKQNTDENPIIEFSKNDIQEKNNEWKGVQEKINDSIEKVKLLPFGNEVDSEGNRIIYKQPDFKLQKWNHILLNYNGGTLDIFYNGRLVKSAIKVVPYMNFDMLTVGTENGVSGNVANLMYFKQPLDLLTINTLYASLKDKNPPVISQNNNKLIPL